MKKYIIGILTLPLTFSFHYAEAQKVEQKKIVIVKEIEDENGKVTKEEKVLTGEEAEAYIKANKNSDGMISVTIDKEISIDSDAEHNEKEVTVDVEEVDGKEVKKIKIMVKGEDGEEKIMEWNGEGDMPEEMKSEMKNIDINIEKGTEEKIVKIISRGDSDHTIIELEEELELPAEVKEKLKKHGIKMGDGNAYFFSDDDNDEIIILKEGEKMEWHSEQHPDEEIIIKKRIRETNPGGKALLGVMVENHINGIEVLEVMEESPAAKAGIKQGDIIFKIGDKTLGSVLQLTHELKAYEGKTAKVKLLRNGKEETLKVVL